MAAGTFLTYLREQAIIRPTGSRRFQQMIGQVNAYPTQQPKIHRAI
jgi:hypothetical protein